MIHVVTGGSGSGKSEYAEQLAVNLGEFPRIYVAAMMVWDDEGRARVKRHRDMRRHKGFETVERYTDLQNLELPPGTHFVKNPPVVLLECMSNLVSNEFYKQGERTAEAVIKGIESLNKKCKSLIIVTNEVFSDGENYGAETMQYIEVLGEVNRYLGKTADSVTEVVYGIPVQIRPPTTWERDLQIK